MCCHTNFGSKDAAAAAEIIKNINSMKLSDVQNKRDALPSQFEKSQVTKISICTKLGENISTTIMMTRKLQIYSSLMSLKKGTREG